MSIEKVLDDYISSYDDLRIESADDRDFILKSAMDLNTTEGREKAEELANEFDYDSVYEFLKSECVEIETDIYVMKP